MKDYTMVGQLLALLRECRVVLDDYWFTTKDDGEYAEDYSNDDVIDLCNRLDVLFAEIDKARL